MTIDDAIKHCYEDAEREQSCNGKNGCVEEHLQLAGWLEELKEIKRVESFPCKVGDRVIATVVRQYNGHKVTIHGRVTEIYPTTHKGKLRNVIRVFYDFDRVLNFYDTDFGKTIFVENDSKGVEDNK